MGNGSLNKAGVSSFKVPVKPAAKKEEDQRRAAALNRRSAPLPNPRRSSLPMATGSPSAAKAKAKTLPATLSKPTTDQESKKADKSATMSDARRKSSSGPTAKRYVPSRIASLWKK